MRERTRKKLNFIAKIILKQAKRACSRTNMVSLVSTTIESETHSSEAEEDTDASDSESDIQTKILITTKTLYFTPRIKFCFFQSEVIG